MQQRKNSSVRLAILKPEQKSAPRSPAQKKRDQIARFLREADFHRKLHAPRKWTEEEIWIEARQNLRIPIPSRGVVIALQRLMWSKYQVRYMGVLLRNLVDVWQQHRPEDYLKEAA